MSKKKVSFPVLSLGVDIEEIATIENLFTTHGVAFLKKCFSNQEQSYCNVKPNKIKHYATRYAAKEATMKALKTGWNTGIQWKHIEVINDGKHGAPILKLHKKALEIFGSQEYSRIELSMSHSSNYVVAIVICY